jgi:arylsulfate sulfotransferase
MIGKKRESRLAQPQPNRTVGEVGPPELAARSEIIRARSRRFASGWTNKISMTTRHSSSTARPARALASFQKRLSGGLKTAFGAAAVSVLAWLPVQPCAANNLATITAQNPGATPFIELLDVHMNDARQLYYVQFTIQPKTGSVTRPLSARYSGAYLSGRGDVNIAAGMVTVPIFGLYEDYTNTVNLVFGFVDGTSQNTTISIAAAHFKDGIYAHPKVVQARTANTALSYDYVLLKAFSDGFSPRIMDSDGNIRWVGTANVLSMQSIFYDNSFFIVGSDQTTLIRMEFDGSFSLVTNYKTQGFSAFGHNFDFGKIGILSEVDTPNYFESTNMEFNPAGQVLHTWDLAAIITKAMLAGGDDPSLFVAAAGTKDDWFHDNCAAYRPSDNSIVISSRENFIIALDYNTKAIKWILGDPTKQWHQFASLAKYALTATAGTPYPIGQHALSFYDDELLLFDCGYQSADHSPVGASRTYSAPRKYSLNLNTRTATQVWTYSANDSLYSPIASSVYEDAPDNYLVDYATQGPYLNAEIIGLSPGNVKVFDYRFSEINVLTTAWNATVLHLENLVFD